MVSSCVHGNEHDELIKTGNLLTAELLVDSEDIPFCIETVAKYFKQSVQSWARIMIPPAKDGGEWCSVEILRGVNVESMTRRGPQITRLRERHMGPCVCVSSLQTSTAFGLVAIAGFSLACIPLSSLSI